MHPASRLAAPALLALVVLAAASPAWAAGPGGAVGRGDANAGAGAVEALAARVENMIYILSNVNATLAGQLNQTLARARTTAEEGNVTGALQLLMEAAREAAEALHEAGITLSGGGLAGAANASRRPLEKAIEVQLRHVELLREAAESLAGEYDLSRVLRLLNQSEELLDEARARLDEGDTSGAASLLAQAARLIGLATSEFYRTTGPALHMQGGLAGLVRRAYKALESVNQTYEALESGSANASAMLDRAMEDVEGALALAAKLQSRPHVMVTWYTEPLNTLATALQAAYSLLSQAREALEAGNTSKALELVGQARDTLAAALDQVKAMAGQWPQLIPSVRAAVHATPGHGAGHACPCPGWAGPGHHRPGGGNGHKAGGRG